MKTHKCTEIILKHFKSSEITYTYSYNLKFDSEHIAHNPTFRNHT